MNSRDAESLRYWVWLSETLGAGSSKIKLLMSHFRTAEDCYHADRRELVRIDGITERDVQKFSRVPLERADGIIAACEKKKIEIVSFRDSKYPDKLRNILAPPVLLYVRGKLPILDDEAVLAVIGTRKATPYGLRASESMAYEFAACGGVVVTGLAKGCDSSATIGAIKAGGRVIGVLGCGADVVYPKENARLYESAVENGAIITEYHPGCPGYTYNFPLRNRIISGISDGVLVTEAPKRSGSLITADRAGDQGRDVFVVPASIDAPMSAGSNELLRDGGMPVLNAAELVESYIAKYPNRLHPELRKAPQLKNNVVPVIEPDKRERKTERKENSTRRTENRKTAAPVTEKVIDKPQGIEYIDLQKNDSVAPSRLDGMTGDELVVARCLLENPQDSDEIVLQTGLPTENVLTLLTMMEVEGKVGRIADMRFELK